MIIVNLLLLTVNLILNNQQWNQLARWRRKFIEPSPSHIKHITGMKRKKCEVNKYAKRCQPFHQKNTIFVIDKCMMLNFKPQEWIFMNKQQKQKQRKMAKVLSHCKSAHRTHWIIFLARYFNNNNNILNIKQNLNQLVYGSSCLEVFLVKGVMKICSKFTRQHPCRSVMILNNKQSDQLTTWRKKCIEPSTSHIKQITGMKCKKGKINQHSNGCEQFH